MNDLLRKLSEAVGVSGDERQVRRLIRDLIADQVDEWRVDTMGNLIARKQGTGASELRVLVDAHMDEVGMMITAADSDGTLRFEAVGSISPAALLGKVVQVGPKQLPGVIGARPIHLLDAAQRNRNVKIDDMRIDIGAKKKEEAERKASIGDRATFLTRYEESGRVALGKAFDNRAGCAALIELLRGEPFPFDLYAVFSVQEEVGLRGAQPAAFSVRPDVAFVLESTPAYDLPNERDASPNVALGRGPSLYVMDAGTIQDPRLVSYLMRTAEAQGIPYQIRQPGGGGTNTSAIQRAGGAVPAATIATPTRYAHAPTSMINLDDLGHVVQLAGAALRNFDAAMLQR